MVFSVNRFIRFLKEKMTVQRIIGTVLLIFSLIGLGFHLIAFFDGWASSGYNPSASFLYYIIWDILNVTVFLATVIFESKAAKIVLVLFVLSIAVESIVTVPAIDITGEIIFIAGIAMGYSMKLFTSKKISYLYAPGFLVLLWIIRVLRPPAVYLPKFILLKLFIVFVSFFILFLLKQLFKDYETAWEKLSILYSQNRDFIHYGKNQFGTIHYLKGISQVRDAALLLRRFIANNEQERALAKLSLIVDSLSQYSERINAMGQTVKNKQLLQRQQLDLNEIIRTVLLNFEQNSDYQHLTKKIELREQPLKISASPFGMTQIVENIIQNSIDVLKEKKNGLLLVKTSRNQRYVELTIEDNGGGMARAPQGKVPFKFFRLGKTEKKEHFGWGMYNVIEYARENEILLEITNKRQKGVTVVLKQRIEEAGE